jgi:catechol 2,3-dioxygenase-like lactoylglutathione lyase family enzyme
VDDVERSARFYHDLFGFETIEGDDRLRALGVCGRQVLLLFRKGASLHAESIPPHDGSGRLHVAFAIPAEDLDRWREHLARKSVPIERERTWQAGGRSLFFRDPDGHLLELATPGTWPIY